MDCDADTLPLLRQHATAYWSAARMPRAVCHTISALPVQAVPQTVGEGLWPAVGGSGVDAVAVDVSSAYALHYSAWVSPLRRRPRHPRPTAWRLIGWPRARLLNALHASGQHQLVVLATRHEPRQYQHTPDHPLSGRPGRAVLYRRTPLGDALTADHPQCDG